MMCPWVAFLSSVSFRGEKLKLDITKMSLLMPYGKVSTAAFEKTAISS